MISVTIIHTAVRRQNTVALMSESLEESGFSLLIDYVQLSQTSHCTPSWPLQNDSMVMLTYNFLSPLLGRIARFFVD